MSKFILQTKAIGNGIWYEAEGILWEHTRTRGGSVEELRKEIRQRADERTLSFAEDVRIITYLGGPVERWKIRPGTAKKLRRRY